MLVLLKRSIPACVAIASAATLLLSGCDQSGASTANVSPTANTADVAEVAEVAPAALTEEASKVVAAEEKVKATAIPAPTTRPTPDADDRAERARKAAEARKKALANLKPVDPETYPVKVTPMTVELGDIPTGDTGKGTFKMVNTGTEAILLNQCKTSCGCTTANCPRGKTLEPNEEIEVEVALKGGQVARTLSKKVTLIFNETETIDVQVRGTAVAYVTVEPRSIDPEKVTDGQLVISSADGNAFRITKMTPEIIAPDDFSAEALERHVLYLDWDKWKEMGSTRLLTFLLDHPKAEKVTANVRVPRAPRTPNKDQATRDLRKPDGTMSTFAIERAIKQGNMDQVMEQITLGKLDLATTDRSGASLVAVAAKYGANDLVVALVKAGADVNATDKVGRTPLMTAAQMKKPETVEALLASGASLEPRDLVGSSALSWASGFGDAESVELLIEAGADTEVSGAPTGFTPLIWAAGFGETGSVQALVDAKANLEAIDMTHGLTPLMHAARTGGVNNDSANLKALVAAGANLEAKDATGKTPLLIACEASGATVEMVQALIDAGADVNAKDARGLGVVELAAKRTDPRSEAVRELLVVMVEKN